MQMPPLKCALIIEDNDALRRAMAATVRQLGTDVLEASTSAEAFARLAEREPDLVVADVCLPDGSALALLDATRQLVPEPFKIGISGQASAEQAFELAQLGVRAYLAKPFLLKDLLDAIDRVRTDPPPLDPVARAAVGRFSLREVASRVRRAMILEALARCHGSRSGAARLLNVTRQAIQQAVGEPRESSQSYGVSSDPAAAAPAPPAGNE
jgi:two-component system, response regulator RegA